MFNLLQQSKRHSVTLFASNSSNNNSSVQEKRNNVIGLSGNITGRVFCHEKCSISGAIDMLKMDLIKSLKARVSILAEEYLGEEATKNNVFVHKKSKVSNERLRSKMNSKIWFLFRFELLDGNCLNALSFLMATHFVFNFVIMLLITILRFEMNEIYFLRLFFLIRKWMNRTASRK